MEAPGNGRTVDKRIKTRQELEGGFGRLVEAKHEINQAEVLRDSLKQKADEQFTDATVRPRAVMEELEPPCAKYCQQHREELLPEGTKSGIVGSVTIAFALTPPTVLTKSGDVPAAEALITKLRATAAKLSGTERKLLLACILEKPQLDKAAVKKLPPNLITKLGLRLHQEERFSWKPNAER